MLAYYGAKLSNNWVQTPEGYLIFKNAVIARTGFQTYKGSELDKEELARQGITVEDDQDVELFRDPEEIFAPKTIASFEAKSVTDGHPDQLLNLETVREHEQGQVVNVRRGSEPLESGDLPLLADLVVKSKNLIEKIKAGLRELSCGYNYQVLRDGNLIKQVDIVGNHVAVVETARAGHEAAIGDSAISIVRFNMQTFLDRVLNRNSKSHLTAWAKDAKPEEIADVITELSIKVEEHSVPAPKPVVAKDARDAKDRKRFHDALDRIMDSTDEIEEAKDADVKELRDMLKTSSANDEEKEKKEEEKEEKPAEDEEEKEEETASDESALTIEPADRPESAGPGTDAAIDDARREGATIVLKALKPLIARTKDKALIGAFDTAAKAAQGKPTGNTSNGYEKFATASATRSKAAQDSAKSTAISYEDAEKAYKERFQKRN